jgi:hypothetical protein
MTFENRQLVTASVRACIKLCYDVPVDVFTCYACAWVPLDLPPLPWFHPHSPRHTQTTILQPL